MPFGQMRVVEGEIVVEGTVVEGTVVEGTVVEGIVVDCGAVVENGEFEGVAAGGIPGVEPTTLLPVLALPPMVGVEPMVLPTGLGGVPVMLGVGVVAKGEMVCTPGVVGDVVPIPGVVVTAPGVVPTMPPGVAAAAPGAAAPAPPAAPPTWESAGNAARLAASKRGKRRESSMGNLLCYRAE
ncbi:MAG TPA: hypothetical protein VGF58_19255 [Burkholderiales bacterium]|jgi:hypothetical protein